jgi:mannose-1-phosphate guanylyltransferase
VGNREGFEYLDVDASVRAGKNVKLLPPVSVAPECEIGHGATIGGRSALARGCRVGEGAVVEGSILLDGAEVEAGTLVRGSIIGKGARVGQGAIVRGLSVLGARCVVGEGNVLDQGIRINPGVVLPPRSLRF